MARHMWGFIGFLILSTSVFAERAENHKSIQAHIAHDAAPSNMLDLNADSAGHVLLERTQHAAISNSHIPKHVSLEEQKVPATVASAELQRNESLNLVSTDEEGHRKEPGKPQSMTQLTAKMAASAPPFDSGASSPSGINLNAARSAMCSQCCKPHCWDGEERQNKEGKGKDTSNPGYPVPDGKPCPARCSQPFKHDKYMHEDTRYCGKGPMYEQEGSIDCSTCTADYCGTCQLKASVIALAVIILAKLY